MNDWRETIRQHEVTGHYRAMNIWAIEAWASDWLKRHRRSHPNAHFDAEGRPVSERAQEIEWLQDWCICWSENDAREGGDPSVRREMRSDWPEVVAAYRKLTSCAIL